MLQAVDAEPLKRSESRTCYMQPAVQEPNITELRATAIDRDVPAEVRRGIQRRQYSLLQNRFAWRPNISKEKDTDTPHTAITIKGLWMANHLSWLRWLPYLSVLSKPVQLNLI